MKGNSLKLFFAILPLFLIGCSSQPTSENKPADSTTETSPIAKGFSAHGEHWSIKIEPAAGNDHKAHLTWGSGSMDGSATLRYRGPVMDAPSTLTVLSGELTTAKGDKPIVVEIKKESCTDDADKTFPYSVSVTVDGIEAGSSPMKGCGVTPS